MARKLTIGVAKREVATVKDKAHIRQMFFVGLGVSFMGFTSWGIYGVGYGILMCSGLAVTGVCAWMLYKVHVEEKAAGDSAGGVNGGAKNESRCSISKVPPGTLCYECLERAAESQCGACKMVFYCGDMCQRQAWRGGHKRVCKLATAAAGRPPPVLTKAQTASLEGYLTLIEHLLDPHGLKPLDPESLTKILHSLGEYLRTHDELLRQPVADRLWRSAANPEEKSKLVVLCAAWAWVVLEESLQAGSVDHFLAARCGLERFSDAAPDPRRLLQWVNQGLGQVFLMLLKVRYEAKLA
eukprot:jgi/Mesen1/11047/ME000099S10484